MVVLPPFGPIRAKQPPAVLPVALTGLNVTLYFCDGTRPGRLMYVSAPPLKAEAPVSVIVVPVATVVPGLLGSTGPTLPAA